VCPERVLQRAKAKEGCLSGEGSDLAVVTEPGRQPDAEIRALVHPERVLQALQIKELRRAAQRSGLSARDCAAQPQRRGDAASGALSE
jgi:hypothetical protein